MFVCISEYMYSTTISYELIVPLMSVYHNRSSTAMHMDWVICLGGSIQACSHVAMGGSFMGDFFLRR